MSLTAVMYDSTGLQRNRSIKPLRFAAKMEPASQEQPLLDPVEIGKQRWSLLKSALKNILLIPIPPAIGYLLFDKTGITAQISHLHSSLHNIIGHEGFGHVGLCFSVHYLVNAGRDIWNALKLPILVKINKPKGQANSGEEAASKTAPPLADKGA